VYSTSQSCNTATGTHMPHLITLCYLPPGRGGIPALTPAETGTRFSDPGEVQGWVDLVGPIALNTLRQIVVTVGQVAHNRVINRFLRLRFNTTKFITDFRVLTSLIRDSIYSPQIKKGLVLSLPVKKLKSANIWQSYKQERGYFTHFVHLATTLLKRKCSI